jgi:hypothetical protein
MGFGTMGESIRTSMAADDAGQPYDERSVRAVVAFLEASPHQVHKGASKKVAEHFLPDGRLDRARAIAEEKGWPLDAVLAGISMQGPVA